MGAVAVCATALSGLGAAEATHAITEPVEVVGRMDGGELGSSFRLLFYVEGARGESILVAIITACTVVLVTILCQIRRRAEKAKNSELPAPAAIPERTVVEMGEAITTESNAVVAEPPAPQESRGQREDRSDIEALLPPLRRSRHTTLVEQRKMHGCLVHEAELRPGRNQYGSFLTCRACRKHCYWPQVPTQGEYVRQDEVTRRFYRILAFT